MTHPNKAMGNGYEYRFLERMIALGAVKTHRNYGSLGFTDVSWTDKNGFTHEAQLKFSSKKMPHVSQKYIDELKIYAKRKTKTKVWLVKKCSIRAKSKDKGKELWTPIN